MAKIVCCNNGINMELLKKFKEENQKIHPHISISIPNPIINPFTKSGFLKFNRK